MNEAPREEHAPSEAEVSKMMAILGSQAPFGPVFFAGQLAGFARDRCPDPRERLPRVELHLHDGTVLDLCHVIGLTPAWLAVAVRDHDGDGGGAMRTELVPYASILRVTLRAVRAAPGAVGFDPLHRPSLIDSPKTPEEMLQLAAAPKGDRHEGGP